MDKIFKIMRASAEFRYRDRHKMLAGCTIGQDSDPDETAVYHTKKEALTALKTFQTKIFASGKVYRFTEYYVQEFELLLDENGEIEDENSLDYIQFTVPDFKVVEKPSYNEVGTFHSVKAAEDFMFEISEKEENTEKEYYIHF